MHKLKDVLRHASLITPPKKLNLLGGGWRDHTSFHLDPSPCWAQDADSTARIKDQKVMFDDMQLNNHYHLTCQDVLSNPIKRSQTTAQSRWRHQIAMLYIHFAQIPIHRWFRCGFHANITTSHYKNKTGAAASETKLSYRQPGGRMIQGTGRVSRIRHVISRYKDLFSECRNLQRLRMYCPWSANS